MKALVSLLLVVSAAMFSFSCAGVAKNGKAGDGGGGNGANAGVGGGGSGVGPADAGGDRVIGPSVDANCGLRTYQLDRRPAEVLLLQDRSQSMSNHLPNSGPTRWEATVMATTNVVGSTEAALAWGLKLFPDTDMACMVSDGVDVPPRPLNAENVIGEISAAGPTADGTPTNLAIRKAAAYLRGLGTSTPKYILLATDGDPNCLDSLTSGDASKDYDGAVAAIADAAKAGIPTAVVGISFSASSTPNVKEVALNRMAVAGSMPRAGGPPSYYAASSTADLITAFSAITGQLISCTFPLDQTPPSPADVAVNLNDKRLPRDETHLDGWDYGPGMASIILAGRPCNDLKASTSIDRLEIIFGCPGAIIP
jgi:hypothetical protein